MRLISCDRCGEAKKEGSGRAQDEAWYWATLEYFHSRVKCHADLCPACVKRALEKACATCGRGICAGHCSDVERDPAVIDSAQSPHQAP